MGERRSSYQTAHPPFSPHRVWANGKPLALGASYHGGSNPSTRIMSQEFKFEVGQKVYHIGCPGIIVERESRSAGFPWYLIMDKELGQVFWELEHMLDTEEEYEEGRIVNE
jgi:hypothetical protein